MVLKKLKSGLSAFNKTTGLGTKVIGATLIILVLWSVGMVVYAVVAEAYQNYQANHLTPAQHLQIADKLCHQRDGVFLCLESDVRQAIEHLEEIPASSSEYQRAATLLPPLRAYCDRLEALQQKLKQAEEAKAAQVQAERNRLMHQSQDDSLKQMLRNVGGEAHDPFICGTSQGNTPILSFDYGDFWWADDGRCVAQQAEIREARERREALERQREQRKRDEDAQSSSYWPTTLRVDTDINSSWLPDEERTCQTYPDANGRVSSVSCEPGRTRHDHNIPVRFWGGVDRNTVSDWKCRRESDQFVCRAID